MAANDHLHCKLLEINALNQHEHLLFAVTHQDLPANANCIKTSMPSLTADIDNAVIETWLTAKAVTQTTVDDVTLRYNEDFCLVSISQTLAANIAQQSKQLYTTLLNAASAQGFTQMIRAWNYMPNINQGDGDSEVYRQFSLGRHQAFEQLQIKPSDYSAASALGHFSDQLVVYLLCAKQAGKHFANPQQMNAYQYPKTYGPKSPSFARATYCEQSNLLFISGTASILGHETQHHDDAEAQLALTLDNIAQLVLSISQQLALNFEPQFFKVYIRKPAQAQMIKQVMEEKWPNIDCLFLQADICRANLLLEIEAVYTQQ